MHANASTRTAPRAVSHITPLRRNALYLGILSASLLAGGLPLNALAATFTVNTVLDTNDANPGDGTAADSQGRVSLRAAFQEANALSGSHSINFHSSVIANGDATITLSLFDSGLDNGEFGKTAFIVEDGTSIALSGPSGDGGILVERSSTSNTAFRIFHVKPTASLSISNLTFANGIAQGGSSGSNTAGGGGAAGLGGAIFNQGNVALEGVTLRNHSALGGNGGNGSSSSDGGAGGGGVGANGGNSSGTTGGVGGGPNGGAANAAATGPGGGGGGGTGRQGAGGATAQSGKAGAIFGGGGGGGSILATGGGAGVATGGSGGAGGFGGGGGGGGGVVSFNYTRIPGLGGSGGFGAGNGSSGGSDPNSAPPSGDGGGGMGAGGAVFNYGGTLTVRNSTITGNTSRGGSSGFVPDPYGGTGPAGSGGAGSGFGAAIFSMNTGSNASVNLRHTTVVENTVTAGQGGAAGTADGAIYLYNPGASAPALVLNNSIIANTSGGSDLVATGSINSGSGNLIESQSGFVGTIVTNADPNIAALADNRGPTPTHALNGGSPAVDSGDPAQIGGLTVDQRGGMFSRVADGDLNGSSIVDIGAYELIQIDYGDAPDFVSGTGEVEVLLESGSDDLRISFAGPDGSSSFFATNPRVAYNATADEFLVVWFSDANVDNEQEVFGQRIDADTRLPVGGAFQISGPLLDSARDNFLPDVAWSSATNEYLVVWRGDNEATDNEFEIYARTVGATGTLLGSQLRISSMGVDTDTTANATDARVAYSSASNEFLVVWTGDEPVAPLVDNENEVFGQRVSAATRSTVGSRMQISFMGGANGDTNFDANNPSIAWNSSSNQFLVTWHADDNANGMVDNEQEAFGRFVAGGGGPLGSTQFRISAMGGSGNTTYRANRVAAAHNPDDAQFLVTWYGDNDSLVDNEIEIWGQRINASTGANVGPMIQISDMGLAGETAWFALNPELAYSPATGNYTVVWHGDDLVDNENEIWARRVDAAGNVLDGNEIRLSTMGNVDGNTSFGAFNAAVAFSSISGDTLVVFNGDDDSGALVDNEQEIYIQFVTDTPLVDYQTRGADNGPAHIRIAGLRLGALTDNDPDGQASLEADGDDLNGVDDEDSVTGLIEFTSSAPVIAVNVTNTSGSPATLYGWIDYNGDGVFDNATERGSIGVPNGTNAANVNLTLPAPVAPVVNTFARFRLSGDVQAANATGTVTGGEVEDYPAISNIDTTPDMFMFTDLTDVALSAQQISAPITVTGINTPSSITVANGEYSINGGGFTTSMGTVNEGDLVRARHTSSSSFSTAVDTSVTIGGIFDVFTTTTEAIDTTPDMFMFTDLADVAVSTQQVSAPITVSGINTSSNITVANGEYSINGGGFTANMGTVNEGDLVRVRHTSSASFETAVDTTVTIGGIFDVFTSTTEAMDTAPDAFSFTAVTNVPLSSLQVSNSASITGINTTVSVSIVNGEYALNGGSFTDVDGTASAGDTVVVRHTSSASFSTQTQTQLSVGSLGVDFVSTTLAEDTAPDDFSFVDQSGVEQSVVVTSAPIVVSGINSPASISVVGGMYSINAGGFTASAGAVVAGDEIRARHTSASADATDTDTTVTIGGVSDTFTSTTRVNGTDAAITKTDGQATVNSGDPVQYTIVVSNAGIDPIASATVTDMLPPALSGAVWTCAADVGASCASSGFGDINDTVSLAVGSSVTYTVSAVIDESFFGVLSNTASVAVNGGAIDINPGNNSASDESITNQIFLDGFEE